MTSSSADKPSSQIALNPEGAPSAGNLSLVLAVLRERLISQVPSAVADLIEPLMVAIAKSEPLALDDSIIAAVPEDLSTGDAFSALADCFRSLGLTTAAEVALEAAARIDFEDKR